MTRPLLTCIVLISSATFACANEASDKLLAMSEPDRNAALTEMIKPSGEPCDAVVRSMHLRSEDGKGAWSVECKDKNSYMLGISPGQKPHIAVLSCADLKILTGGFAKRLGLDPAKETAECWKK